MSGAVQMPLFDLPEAARDTARAELPESLKQLIEAGLSARAAEGLVRMFGGVVISVPKRVRPDHPLVDAMGLAGATVLARHMGGTRYAVPKGDGLARAARNAEIRHLYDQGTPVRQLARRFGLTERTVWAVLGRG